jgi:hypothetical protein
VFGVAAGEFFCIASLHLSIIFAQVQFKPFRFAVVVLCAHCGIALQTLAQGFASCQQAQCVDIIVAVLLMFYIEQSSIGIILCNCWRLGMPVQLPGTAQDTQSNMAVPVQAEHDTIGTRCAELPPGVSCAACKPIITLMCTSTVSKRAVVTMLDQIPAW